METVNKLSEAGIAYEKALRALRKPLNDYLDAIEACATDPEINKLGLYNIDTSEFRQRVATANCLTEEAHALICMNHHDFNAIAKEYAIGYTTKDGGGR